MSAAPKKRGRPAGSKNKAGTPTKKKLGRPEGKGGLYTSDYDKLAYKFCLLGAEEDDLADLFEVNRTTVLRWKEAHPSFKEAIKEGKYIADQEVADSLFKRAKGYSHPEEKVFMHNGIPVIVPTTKHYAPDTTAAIYWLNNRQSQWWKTRKEYNTNLTGAAPEQIAEALKALSEKLPV